MILEFQTRLEAETALNVINQMASAWWQSQGFTVVQNNGKLELIGKKNGVDNPDAARTLSWDVVKESPVGTFYFTSLTGTRPEWKDWKPMLAQNFGFTALGVEKEFPQEWVSVEDN